MDVTTYSAPGRDISSSPASQRTAAPGCAQEFSAKGLTRRDADRKRANVPSSGGTPVSSRFDIASIRTASGGLGAVASGGLGMTITTITTTTSFGVGTG